MKTHIEDILDRIGFDKKSMGFWYIVEYVNLLDKPEWRDANPIAIYGEVAKMFRKDVGEIVRTISCKVRAVRIGSSEDYIFENQMTTDVLKSLHNKLVDERSVEQENIRNIVREEIMFAMCLFFPERKKDGL